MRIKRRLQNARPDDKRAHVGIRRIEGRGRTCHRTVVATRISTKCEVAEARGEEERTEIESGAVGKMT